MKIAKVACCFLLITNFFFFNSSYASGDVFKRIIFFGDSLTDDGNLYQIFLKKFPKSPPYYKGRFSNGEVWSELVAKHYESHSIASVNYAYGGQTVLLHSPTNGFLPYTLGMSVKSYLRQTTAAEREESLLIIWIGANDYLLPSNHVEDLTTDVALRIQQQIEKLIEAGVKNFLVLNLPNMAETPYSHFNQMEKFLKEAVELHNTKLQIILNEIRIRNTAVNIKTYDINDLYDVIHKIIDPNGEINFQEACWQGGYWFQLRGVKAMKETAAQQLIMDEKIPIELANFIVNSPDLFAAYSVETFYGKDGMACLFADKYFFWDFVHPTKIIHKVMATMIIEFIEKNFEKN